MRLIRGAAGSGKTALVLREFEDAHRGGKRARIVVPTATLVRHTQHELARAGLVFDPGQVVSLSRYAAECAPGVRLASATLVRALTRDALKRLSLPEFADVAETQGMADVALETMGRFENTGCTPEKLGRVRGLTAQGRAFQRLWKEVEAGIAARGFVTRGGLFRAAVKSVAAGAIWLDGFLKFSPVEGELLRAMAAQCELTLTLSDGPETTEAYRFAMELGAKDRLLPAVPRRVETIAVTAPSPLREADEIARRILAMNREGMPFSRIAVALRDVESWLPLLRNAFDRFGVPARWYFSTPAARHPAVVFLDGLVKCALDGWDFAATLAALRAHPGWGSSADFDRFDFKVREKMPGRGGEAFLSLCESETLRGHIADCLKVDAWRGERLRPRAWQRRLEEMAASLYRIRTVPEPRDYAALESARSHAAALRAWSAAVEAAVEFCQDMPVSLDAFHQVMRDALDSLGMQIPDDRQNAVHVMSALEARQWRVQSLFVCGMTARDYPRATPPDLLFPDADKQILRKAGIPLIDQEQDESQLFALLRTRPTEKLILSVSKRDQAGKTIVASEHFGAATAKALLCAPAPRAKVAPSQPGRISEAALAELAAQHTSIRLTALEDLMKCRFRFFASRSLKLATVPDRPEKRLQPRVRGSIFHQAMEIWLGDRTLDFVGLFESTFEKFCREYNIPQGYSLEVERILSRRIAQEVNASIQWPTVSSEAEVDCSLEFPGGVTITGRVDRIDDIGNGNCIIVDYKSGKVENVDKLVEAETSLQGPLYALAVREKKNLNTVAMVFLAIREGKPVGWGAVPGGDFELNEMPADWIESARERSIARLRSFLAGDVHPEPHTADECKWCDYRNACRVEQIAELIQIGAAGAE
ncbi:MAG TPA: PD-(D/E)XK nuclease family protein [Bryobacteraceae bacterium]|nr:PD-(D/E)XK nuclease family protein [Bryobacteraceae bacterium]